MRIWIVDGEKDVRVLIRNYLKILGHETIEFRIGEEKLTHLKNSSRLLPDLIVLDVFLFDSKSWGVVQHLTTHPAWQKIPVILTTATPNVTFLNFAKATGLCRIIPKPFDFAIFEQNLKQLVVC